MTKVNFILGTSCGGNSSSLACASGQCTSRDLQCKTLMGSYTQGNDTYACSSSGCQITCASPEFGANVCYSMQQNFLDGTSCQGGGKCDNGLCEGASVGKEISSWISSNKTLVIALTSVIGGLILIATILCCWRSFKRRSRVRKLTSVPPPGWAGSTQGLRVPANGPQMRSNKTTPSGSGYWQNGRWMPTQPPPAAWHPGPSVRYA